MKHRKIYNWVFFIAVLIAFTACEKEYLDRSPSNGSDEDEIFKSVSNVTVALNGVYRGLYRQYSDQEEDGHPAIMINMDYLGEDIVHTESGTSYFRNTYRWIGHTSEVNDLCLFAYRLYYTTIAGVNKILDRIDEVPGSETEINGIKGECLALRAWSHFQLVQLYAVRYQDAILPSTGAIKKLGVPVLTTYTLEPQPRQTVDSVYKQINKDLDSAIVFLNSSPARKNKTHVDISVAKGIKARVALTTQQWADAAKYASEARTGYSLMSNADYLSGFSYIGNSEWMWGVTQLPDQLPNYGSFFSYMSANFNSVHTRTNPKIINSALYASIPSTDIRKKIWWDGTAADEVNFPGLFNVSINGPEPTQLKRQYMHRKFLVSDPASSAGDIPFMRVAEMYLIEAEARANMNQGTTAANVLAVLLQNRNPSYVKPGSVTASDVLLQRRIELWGEGFRFLDLKRTKSPLNRYNTGAIGRLANWMGVSNVDDRRWQFMIPRREMQNNPYMIQNPIESNEE